MASGVVAEFDSEETFEHAFDHLKATGHGAVRTWSPFPVRSVEKAMPPSIVPWVMLIAGALGGGAGYLIEWWTNAYRYPIDVGGRPMHSVPAFIPITFESCVLAASLAGFFALLQQCGLPRLHHPAFAIDGFERATVDRFFLWVPAPAEGVTPLFEELARLGALRWETVGWEP